MTDTPTKPDPSTVEGALAAILANHRGGKDDTEPTTEEITLAGLLPTLLEHSGWVIVDADEWANAQRRPDSTTIIETGRPGATMRIDELEPGSGVFVERNGNDEITHIWTQDR